MIRSEKKERTMVAEMQLSLRRVAAYPGQHRASSRHAILGTDGGCQADSDPQSLQARC